MYIKKLTIKSILFLFLLVGIFIISPVEIFAFTCTSGEIRHQDYIIIGAQNFQWSNEDYENAANIGRCGKSGGTDQGAYDNIIFTNLSPGRYKVKTHGMYGGQSDEHMHVVASDGDVFQINDPGGNYDWIWTQGTVNLYEQNGSITVRSYSPGVGPNSLELDEIMIELITPFNSPDLTAAEPTLNSGTLAEGSNLTFAGNINNQGTADAIGTFDNEFQLDIGYSGSFAEDLILTAVSSITNLLAGESKQAISSAWNNAPLGTHAVRLCADVSSCASMPGLVAHWKFDEGSGLTAEDSSGNGNTGTLSPSNGGPSWTTGIIGGALSFDGINDYVKAPYSSGLAISGDLTISAWVYRDTTSTIDSLVTFSNPGENQADNHQYEFVIQSDNKLRIDFEYGPGTQTQSVSSATISNPSGSWVHYVLTRDSIAKEVRFYENGNELVGTAQSYLYNADGGEDDNLYIGLSTKYTGGFKDYHDGRIDDVRIYDRVLSAGEIAQIYNSCDADKGISESDETNNCSPPYVFSIPPKPECSDSKDNDTDNLFDFPEDPGCSSPNDTSELDLTDPVLYADPNPISQGDSSTLSWTCYDSTIGKGSGFFTADATTGLTSVSPESTTTYTLQCFNGADGRGQAVEQITVLNIPAVNISANPATVRQGNASTITWSSTDVDSCSVTGPNGFSYTALSGSESTGAITQESVYTIVCQNAVTQVSAQVKVTLLPKFEER